MTDLLMPLTLVNKDLQVTKADLQIISSSVSDLLSTQRGSIFGMESYGCDIHKLKHNALNEVTAELGKAYIVTALRQFEKRVRIVSIGFTINRPKLTYNIKLAQVNGEVSQVIETLFTINF